VLSYWLTVTNHGPQPASAVLVTNLLPAAAALVSASASQGICTNYGQTVVCQLGQLSNSAGATLSVTVIPAAPADIVLITNTAFVTANEPDTNLLNNTAQAVTTVWLDSIGDGIPNWWRAQYFGVGNATNSLSCATCDPDGDGFNNAAEFLADTNPTNGSSFLGFSGVSLVPGGVRLQWHGGSAARQFLQGRFNLASTNGGWLDLYTNQPPTPIQNFFTNPATAPAGLFRIRATRP
jgi:uncharacterized repeat protein (TIGR01451 family)